MSEYERQRRAVQGELRSRRLTSFLFRLLLLIVFVVAGYVAVGYYAMSMLPEQITELERRQSSQTVKAEDFQKDQAELRSCLEAAGYKPGTGDQNARRSSLVKLLSDSRMAKLTRKHGGASAEKANQAWLDLHRRIGKLKAEEAKLKNRESMLSKEFDGPVGKGSKAWQLKMAKIRGELDKLTKALEELDAEAMEKFESACTRVAELRAAVSAGSAELTDVKEQLEGLRQRRKMLMVWPLPLIEKEIKNRSK